MFLVFFVVLVAISTVNWSRVARSIVAWFERDFAFFATICTNCFMHFSWAKISATASASTKSVSTAKTSAGTAGSFVVFHFFLFTYVL